MPQSITPTLSALLQVLAQALLQEKPLAGKYSRAVVQEKVIHPALHIPIDRLDHLPLGQAEQE
ncbi:MAG TPA: hypothetical protein VK200_08435 [Candidatus Limnocylindrales bacterium]|nr:hypothetical protein [Candidatus Limnocylindrales bacterium]